MINRSKYVIIWLMLLLSPAILFSQEVVINDNLAVEADGTLRMDNDATVWDDLNVYPDAVSTRGASDPDYLMFKDDGSGSVGVWLYMFDAGTEEELFFTVQVPHGYKEGSNLQPHVHWTAPSGTPAVDGVVWGLEYTVISIGDNYGNTTTILADSIIPSITISGTGQHLINAFPEISGTGLKISSIINCRLFRDADNADDTYSGDIGLLGMDFHYEQDTQGSRLPFIK